MEEYNVKKRITKINLSTENKNMNKSLARGMKGEIYLIRLNT